MGGIDLTMWHPAFHDVLSMWDDKQSRFVWTSPQGHVVRVDVTSAGVTAEVGNLGPRGGFTPLVMAGTIEQLDGRLHLALLDLIRITRDLTDRWSTWQSDDEWQRS